MDVSLPVVDLSSPDRLGNARAIVHAMETIGFLVLDNIPGYDEQKLLEATRWFFDLPLERRMRVSRKKWNEHAKNLYRGYFPVDHEAISFKEGLEMGPEIPENDPELITGFPFVEHNSWPQAEEGEDEEPFMVFRETMTAHYKSFFAASIEFMRLLAIGLHLEENFFDYIFIPNTLSTLRLLSYPPRTKPPPPCAVMDDGTVLYCDSHADVGIVTMLTSFGQPGLQVFLSDGSWLDVKSAPGTMMVNLGEMLSEMSGNQIKATQHRVVDTGGRRLSCPFFLEPGYHAKLPLSLPTRSNGPSTQPAAGSTQPASDGYLQYGPLLWERLKRRAEYGQDFTKTDK